MHYYLIAIIIVLSIWPCHTEEFRRYNSPHTLADRTTMVQLFEWKWSDVANECETFLSQHKYGAVHVSPPQEHVLVTKTVNGVQYSPWWIRYQPVSYKLVSKSGNEREFADMVARCNKVGVRIIPDVVLNHMTGENMEGNGSAGTYYNTKHGQRQFSIYSKPDFNDPNCHTANGDMQNFNDIHEVRKCKLLGLTDLDQSKAYVRQQIVNYLNQLIDIGVAGFRIDAAKHMMANDIKFILDNTKNLNKDIFGEGKRPFVVQEVIDKCACENIRGDEYLVNGRITNFRFGEALTKAVQRHGGDNFKWFANFGVGWQYWADNDVLVFIDNHDKQRDGEVLTYKNGDQYIMAVAYMLAWSYGYPRVMSSYYFNDFDQGPPNSGAPTFSTTSPSFNSDATCNAASGWACEHRWPAIRRMVGFRSAVVMETAASVVTEEHRIAFRRGNRGFFALNNDPSNPWSRSFKTGLPTGVYCDIISGEPSDTGCTGASVSVDVNGTATVTVGAGKTFAIHIYAKSGMSRTLPETIPVSSPFQRTVVFIKKTLPNGQYLFARGGLDKSHISGCSTNNVHCINDSCSIPISSVHQKTKDGLDRAKGDRCLDWYGAEPEQETTAAGTPMIRTTNDENDPAYTSLNTFGPDHWMFDVEMDCSRTFNGWFEIKAYVQDGSGLWETDRQQESCTGSAGGLRPYQSGNHFGRCGYVNVFSFNSNTCVINNF